MGVLFFGEWPAPRAPSKMALGTPLLGHWNHSWQVQPNLGALSGGPGSLQDRILRALGQLNSVPLEGWKEKGPERGWCSAQCPYPSPPSSLVNYIYK